MALEPPDSRPKEVAEGARRSPRELTDKERQALIERARRELPELDRQVEEGLRRLRRFAAG